MAIGDCVAVVILVILGWAAAAHAEDAVAPPPARTHTLAGGSFEISFS